MIRPAIQYCIIALLLASAALAVTPGIPAATAAENPDEESDLRALSIEELMMIEVETVYSTSKYEQKVTEAPSAVTIVTAADIRRYGYRTLADILKSVRGFSVAYDRTYTYLGVRGFNRPGDYNTRVLLLIDGHRMNDNVYDSAPIGTEFTLDVDLIDRIEISRGPGSSLYGSNAFFAVVNIMTRRGRDLNGAEISGEAASFRTFKGRVSLGGEWEEGRDALLSGTAFSSRGDILYFPEYDPENPFFDTRAADNGVAEYRDYDRFHSLFMKSSSQGLTVQGAFSSRTKGIPTASYGTDFNDPGNKVKDQRAYLDLNYHHPLTSRTSLSARIYYDLAEYNGDYLYDGVVNKDWSRGEWAGGEAQLSTSLTDMHRVIVGAEYVGNLRQDQRNADEEPFFPYLDDHRRSRRWAAYIQDDVHLGSSLRLNAGIRYDHDTAAAGIVNPRLALILNPAADRTIKLLYGSAFRSPTVYERYYQIPSSSPSVMGNPELKHEKIKTSELVYEEYFTGGVRAGIGGYYYRIKNLIDLAMNTAGVFVFTNLEESEARGLELEIEKKWANGSHARLSYALQRAINSGTGEVLDNSPREMAKLNVALPLLEDRAFAGIEEQYTSRRKTVSGASVDDFMITTMTISGRNASRTVELSLSCYNLFNERYSDPVSVDLAPLTSVEQDGRTLRFKVTYVF
jgi:iron complex outermembrane receptor protein